MHEEPVEILVTLAEQGEIDPWNIDIVEVTDRFLSELERLKTLDLRVSGRTLFYAATLLRMKSEYLDEVEEDSDEFFQEEIDELYDGFGLDEEFDVDDINEPIERLEREIQRRIGRNIIRIRGHGLEIPCKITHQCRTIRCLHISRDRDPVPVALLQVNTRIDRDLVQSHIEAHIPEHRSRDSQVFHGHIHPIDGPRIQRIRICEPDLRVSAYSEIRGIRLRIQAHCQGVHGEIPAIEIPSDGTHLHSGKGPGSGVVLVSRCRHIDFEAVIEQEDCGSEFLVTAHSARGKLRCQLLGKSDAVPLYNEIDVQVGVA